VSLQVLVEIALSVIQIGLAIGLAYHYGLLIAGIKRPRATSVVAPRITFAITIPAHNEELVIRHTIDQLARLDYPRELFDIYVVADYCSDNTAQVAREAGAICFERNEGPRGRKAYPLQWILQCVLTGVRQYDAFIVFDADSQVDPEFLRAMSAGLECGNTALQGQRVIANTGDSPLSRLEAIDMRLNNLLRNRAKHNLGLSCRLMGDAMCFTNNLIRAHGWSGESLTEDREFEMYLLLQGERVCYAPGAVSYSQATSRWKDASQQHVRWYAGAFELQKKFVGPLLKHGLIERDPAMLDRAIELILPPFSTLSVATASMLIVQLIWPGLTLFLPVGLTLFASIAWIMFPFAGLIIERAPGWAYQAMIYAPVYVAWRITQGLRVVLKRGQVEWVRTRRREEHSEHV
jgi:1,2-diacylglycerol 3-beta-glucosyltransferase